MNLNDLSAYFAPDDLDWKPITVSRKTGKGLAAAYITARAVQQRLDDVCGPENWQNRFSPGPAGGVVCGISIRIVRDGEGEWVTKWDGADNTDIEATKGGLSDSMRRAAVQWGIGRYLYNFPSQWVEMDEYGKFKQPPKVPPKYLPSRIPAASPHTKGSALPPSETPRTGEGASGPDGAEIARQVYGGPEANPPATVSGEVLDVIDELGRTLYGDEWERRRSGSARWASGGETAFLRDLAASEGERLTAELERRIRADRPAVSDDTPVFSDPAFAKPFDTSDADGVAGGLFEDSRPKHQDPA